MTPRQTAARDQRIKVVLADAPPSARKSLTRAFSGAGSPRQAIKIFCMACTGFERDEVRKCSAWACPLWQYRPFQDEPK